MKGTMNKTTLYTAGICLLLGLGLGSQLFPKIEEKTVEIEKEKIVKDVVTVTKIITKPDGTKEEVTVVTDKSKESKEIKNTKIVSKLDWHVSASAKTKSIQMNDLVYSVQVERRILGDIYLGVVGSSDKSAGLSVGFEF